MKSIYLIIIFSILSFFSCNRNTILIKQSETDANPNYPLFQTRSKESKIGFEFEGDICLIANNDTSFAMLNPKDVIMRSNNNTFEVQADYVSEVKTSDLEIVTKPFLYKTDPDIQILKKELEEIAKFLMAIRDAERINKDRTDSNDLDKIYNQLLKSKNIKKNINELDSKIKRKIYESSVSLDHESFESYTTTLYKNVIVPFSSPEYLQVTSQLTFSLNLEAIFKLYEEIATEKRSRHFFSLEKKQCENLANIYELTESDKFGNTLDKLNLSYKNKALKGFLILVYTYINKYNKGSENDYKNLLPILRARTDFGTIFNLLDFETTEILKTDDNLAILINSLSEQDYDMNSPLFNGSYLKGSDSEMKIFERITKKDWLKQITQGRDLLTLEAYKEYYETEPSQTDLEAMPDFSDLLNKTETINGKNTPIFELRNHHNLNLGKDPLKSNQVVIDKFVRENMEVVEDIRSLNYPNK